MGGKRVFANKDTNKELNFASQVAKSKLNSDSGERITSLESVFNHVSKVAFVCEVSMTADNSSTDTSMGVEEVTPEDDFSKSESWRVIKDAFKDLSEIERFIINEYYVNNKSFTAIGEMMVEKEFSGYRILSGSWVCRVHHKAISRLRLDLIKKGVR